MKTIIDAANRLSPSELEEFAEQAERRFERLLRRRECERLRRSGRPLGRLCRDEWAPLRGALTWDQALGDRRFDE